MQEPRVIDLTGPSTEEGVGEPVVTAPLKPRAVEPKTDPDENGIRNYQFNTAMLMKFALNEAEDEPATFEDRVMACFQVMNAQYMQVNAMLQGLMGLATGQAKPQLIKDPRELDAIRQAIRRP